MSSAVQRSDRRRAREGVASLVRGLFVAVAWVAGGTSAAGATADPLVTLRLAGGDVRSVTPADRARLAERGLADAVQPGQIEAAQLDGLSGADRFVVEAADGRRFVFTRERIEQPPSGGTVWVGRLQSDAPGLADPRWAHLSVQDGQVVGTLELPDVLIAYTAGMVTRYGSTAGVVARLNNLVAYANTAYATSEVAITLRLVHSVEVSYPDDGANNTALYSLTGHNGSTSVTVPASLSAIAGLRNTHGADLVALIRPYTRASHGSCGVGWVGGYNVSDIGDDAPFGHSVTSDGSDVGGSGFFCTLGTFAHELGHNMGLMHDRANAGGGQGATPYAFGYIIPGTSNGDVMSYASGRIQAFSNPALRCTGTTCSVAGSGSALGVPADGTGEACLGSPAGCPASQASTCTTNPSTCADAARALNFTRVKVAAYRTAASAPSISGTARLTGGANVPNGTALCASPATGVTCTTTNNGAYNCTVPSGWTGTLHLQAGNNRRVAARRFMSGVTTATTGQDFTVAENTAFACNLDVDNNGLLEGAIDGAMVVRRLMGLTPTAAVVANNGVCAQRTATADKAAFLAGQSYDFDGGGASAAREGLVLLRLMLGVPGPQAVVGTGYSWATVQAQINAACGTTF